MITPTRYHGKRATKKRYLINKVMKINWQMGLFTPSSEYKCKRLLQNYVHDTKRVIFENKSKVYLKDQRDSAEYIKVISSYLAMEN